VFWFTQEPSSGSYNQCLAKITSLVQLRMLIQKLSVLWRHILTVIKWSWCWTRLVILAKRWLQLPDNGSWVSWNMLEQLL